MKLWQKNYSVHADIERFTVGRDRELDLLLAKYDVLGSLAHIRMLTHIGLLTAAELQQLAPALRRIYQQAKAGAFVIEPGVEDVHSQVELMLTRELGEVGKKIHAGRSRNDQVLVDLRLFFRAEIQEIAELTRDLGTQLLTLAEQYKTVLLPGYTHLQVAMVSSFGLWFSAYTESLTDDLQLLQSVYSIINRNPLGSAAGYGSSFPLDRRMTTELLGFEELNYNVVHAQMGRGKSELFLAFALAGLGSTLGKLAMDVTLYMNQNFGFIHFPDELTTGSSIMPHKKNPDVFELIRARCNQLQSLPAQVSQLTGTLPSGYHRDFQLLKEQVFPAIESMKSCLRIATFALSQIQIRTDILEDDKYLYLFSVEEVNRMVLAGVPFRDAYRQVGADIAKGTFQPEKAIAHTHDGSIGNLCLPEIQARQDAILDAFHFAKAQGKLAALLEA
ncbi:MAG TPA: argininosuccinate lyase [Saprospiraceae bacterium]|nr:argininosuccinate lyase [Saprospiraceae bacterium]HMP24906.1 argininosuccinate lyase [Saprospiraceae bacterium]